MTTTAPKSVIPARSKAGNWDKSFQYQPSWTTSRTMVRPKEAQETNNPARTPSGSVVVGARLGGAVVVAAPVSPVVVEASPRLSLPSWSELGPPARMPTIHLLLRRRSRAHGYGAADHAGYENAANLGEAGRRAARRLILGCSIRTTPPVVRFLI